MNEFDILMLELAACEPAAEPVSRPAPPPAWTEDAIAAAFYRDVSRVDSSETE